MSKVSLAVKPTFDLPVSASQLGGGKIDFTVTYKYRTQTEYNALFDPARAAELKQRSDRELIMELAQDWGLDVPFTPEGIEDACNREPGIGSAVVLTYVREYERVRLGN